MSVQPMLYAFPDDGGATLEAVLRRLPDERAAEMIVHGSGLSQLRLKSRVVAVYLSMLLEAKERRCDPTSPYPYTLRPVADDARSTCDSYLLSVGAEAMWQPFIVAAPFNKPAQDDFEEAWRRLAGPRLIRHFPLPPPAFPERSV